MCPVSGLWKVLLRNRLLTRHLLFFLVHPLNKSTLWLLLKSQAMWKHDNILWLQTKKRPLLTSKSQRKGCFWSPGRC